VGGREAVTVHFIGAGPGAPDLLTLRGRDLIAACPVCLYAGSLVPEAVLAPAPDGARLVDTAELDLDRIVELMNEAHLAGQDVARLHSGDLSIFSAMAEQMRRLDALGVPYDVTPGVPAYAAAAAALRRELTIPEVGQTIVLSRISSRSSAMPPGEDLASLAAGPGTLVLHLAVQAIERVVEELLPARGPDCPVAVVARASWDDELILRGTLASIAGGVRDAGVRRTAVIIVGPVLAAEGFRDSHLYSKARPRSPEGGPP
jgi:precorrin-4/cobalt-precorrin-4 C11-methyltransferase